MDDEIPVSDANVLLNADLKDCGHFKQYLVTTAVPVSKNLYKYEYGPTHYLLTTAKHDI